MASNALLTMLIACIGQNLALYISPEDKINFARGLKELESYIDSSLYPTPGMEPCYAAGHFALALYSKEPLLKKLSRNLQPGFIKSLERISQIGLVCSVPVEECKSLMNLMNPRTQRQKRRWRRRSRRRQAACRRCLGGSGGGPGSIRADYYVIPIPIPPCEIPQPPQPPPEPPLPPEPPTEPPLPPEPPPPETLPPEPPPTEPPQPAPTVICIPCGLVWAPCQPSCGFGSFPVPYMGGGAPSAVSYGSGSSVSAGGGGYVPVESVAPSYSVPRGGGFSNSAVSSNG